MNLLNLTTTEVILFNTVCSVKNIKRLIMIVLR